MGDREYFREGEFEPNPPPPPSSGYVAPLVCLEKYSTHVRVEFFNILILVMSLRLIIGGPSVNMF